MKTYPFKTTTELVDLAKNNDQRAFTELYNRYIKYISFIVNQIVKVPEEAEEIIQDTFTKAFSSMDLYVQDHSFGYWLRTIAKNKSIDWTRRQSEELVLSMDDDNGLSNKHTDNTTAATNLMEKSDKQHLHHIVENLKWKDRRIFKLRYVDHLKYDEIATKLGVSIGTVKSHLHNVKNKLIKQLQ